MVNIRYWIFVCHQKSNSFHLTLIAGFINFTLLHGSINSWKKMLLTVYKMREKRVKFSNSMKINEEKMMNEKKENSEGKIYSIRRKLSATITFLILRKRFISRNVKSQKNKENPSWYQWNTRGDTSTQHLCRLLWTNHRLYAIHTTWITLSNIAHIQRQLFFICVHIFIFSFPLLLTLISFNIFIFFLSSEYVQFSPLFQQ